MSGIWYYLGYPDEKCAYKVSGTLYKDYDDDVHQYIITMQYDNFRYRLRMHIKKNDLTEESLSILFIGFFIKKLKQLMENKIEYLVLDGMSIFDTDYCKIYHRDGEYFVCSYTSSLDDWTIKFDNNFGKKLLDVLEHLSEEVQKLIQV